MGRLSVVRTVLILLIFVTVAGCNKEPAQESLKYSSVDDVNRFLKEQYFDVPEVPAAVEDFEYTMLNGKTESFFSNSENVILLNFWATWCYPCKKEMPDMQALQEEMKGEKFRILAVNYGESSKIINRYIQKFNYTFDVVTDMDTMISSRMKIKGLPTTVLIDKNGRILGKLVGPANWSKKVFLEFFKALSQKQP